MLPHLRRHAHRRTCHLQAIPIFVLACLVTSVQGAAGGLRGEEVATEDWDNGEEIVSSRVLRDEDEDEAELEREEEKRAYRTVRRLFFYILVCIPEIIFIIVYKQQVVDRVPKLPVELGDTHVQTDFQVPFFYCFNDTELCLYTTFCMTARSSHTLEVAGICEYYAVAAITILFGFSFNFFNWIFRTYWRYKLRQKLGIKSNIVMDAMAHLFCPCCAIAQEAKAVDQEVGVQVGCFLDVKFSGSQQGVIEGGGQMALRRPNRTDNEEEEEAEEQNVPSGVTGAAYE